MSSKKKCPLCNRNNNANNTKCVCGYVFEEIDENDIPTDILADIDTDIDDSDTDISQPANMCPAKQFKHQEQKRFIFDVDKLKTLMAEYNLNETELHIAMGFCGLGVSRSQTDRWVKKGSQPKLDSLYKIALFFGVSIETLIKEQE